MYPLQVQLFRINKKHKIVVIICLIRLLDVEFGAKIGYKTPLEFIFGKIFLSICLSQCTQKIVIQTIKA